MKVFNFVVELLVLRNSNLNYLTRFQATANFNVLEKNKMFCLQYYRFVQTYTKTIIQKAKGLCIS